MLAAYRLALLAVERPDAAAWRGARVYAKMALDDRDGAEGMKRASRTDTADVTDQSGPAFRNRAVVAFRDAEAEGPPTVRVAMYAAANQADVANDGRAKWLGTATWALDDTDVAAANAGERVSATRALEGPGASGTAVTVSLLRVAGPVAAPASQRAAPQPPEALSAAHGGGAVISVHVCELRNLATDEPTTGTRVVLEVTGAADARGAAPWATITSRRRKAARSAGYDEVLTVEVQDEMGVANAVLRAGVVNDEGAVVGMATLPLRPFASIPGPHAFAVDMSNDADHLVLHASLHVDSTKPALPMPMLCVALQRWEPSERGDDALIVVRCELLAGGSRPEPRPKIAPFTRRGAASAGAPHTTGTYVALVWGDAHPGVALALPDELQEAIRGGPDAGADAQLIVDLFKLPLVRTPIDEDGGADGVGPDVRLIEPSADGSSGTGEDIIAKMLSNATSDPDVTEHDTRFDDSDSAASLTADFLARSVIPLTKLQDVVLGESEERLSLSVEANDAEGAPLGQAHFSFVALVGNRELAAPAANEPVPNRTVDVGAAVAQLLSALSDEDIARELAAVLPKDAAPPAEGTFDVLLGDCLSKQATVEYIGAQLDRITEANMLLHWKMREHKAKTARVHAELNNARRQLEEERNNTKLQRAQVEARAVSAVAELNGKSKEELVGVCTRSYEQILAARRHEQHLQMQITHLKKLVQSSDETNARYDELAGAHKVQNAIIARQDHELKRMRKISDALAMQEEVIAKLEKVAEAGSAARRALTNAEEERDSARKELQQLQADVQAAADASAEREAERAAEREAELAADREKEQASEERLKAVEKDLADTRAELQASKQAYQDVADELEATKTELNRLRDDNQRMQDTIADQDKQLLGPSKPEAELSADPSENPAATPPRNPTPPRLPSPNVRASSRPSSRPSPHPSARKPQAPSPNSAETAKDLAKVPAESTSDQGPSAVTPASDPSVPAPSDATAPTAAPISEAPAQDNAESAAEARAELVDNAQPLEPASGAGASETTVESTSPPVPVESTHETSRGEAEGADSAVENANP